MNPLGPWTDKQARSLLEKRNDSLKGGEKWRQLDFFVGLALVVLLALCLRAVVAEPNAVKGPSMEDTLSGGDYMFMEKISYIFRPMERGDLVICYYPHNDEYTCVKRIIGLPGERVDIRQGRVYINGALLEETYLTKFPSANHDGSWLVGEGTVFVLGDNRSVSKDSTNPTVGCIPQERILGRVRTRLLPLNQFTVFSHWEY